MRKTDKKIENNIIAVLANVCESALKDFAGFQWLTHVVNYSTFPESLKIVCVFDTKDNLSHFIKSGSDYDMNALIENKLLNIGAKSSQFPDCILYDTEEECDEQHNGKWANRLPR